LRLAFYGPFSCDLVFLRKDASITDFGGTAKLNRPTQADFLMIGENI
jgi:hypothetical protein